MFKINDIISGRRRDDSNSVRYEQLFGIEIEVEDVLDTSWTNDTRWRTKEDGSLRRGGCEFYTPPLTYTRAVEALTQFYAQPTGTFGPRCGIHVHLDMRTRTMQEVLTFATLYSIVEPALFEQYCGMEREECTYCVPWYRANEDAAKLYDVTQRGDMHNTQMVLGGTCKYSALNLASLTTFGTVEFRGAPTFEREEDMLAWLDCINNLLTTSLQYGTPYAVIETAETSLLSELITPIEFPRPQDAVDMIRRYETIPKTADMYIPGETGTGESNSSSNWGFGNSLEPTQPVPERVQLEDLVAEPIDTREEERLREDRVERMRQIDDNIRTAEQRARAERAEQQRRRDSTFRYVLNTTSATTDWRIR